MRGQEHVEGLRERGDPAHFGDAARVGEVRLGDGDACLEGGQEVGAGEEPLPGGDGHSGGRDHVPERWVYSGSTGSSTNNGCSGARWSRTRRAFAGSEPAVEVHGEVPVGAEHFADGFGACDDLGDVVRGGERVGAAGSVHLHRGEPGVDLFRDRVGDSAGLVPADPAVGPHPVAYRAAEQHVHGAPSTLPAMSHSAWSSPATALDSTGPPR